MRKLFAALLIAGIAFLAWVCWPVLMLAIGGIGH